MKRLAVLMQMLTFLLLMTRVASAAQAKLSSPDAVAEIEKLGGTVTFAGSSHDRKVVGVVLRGPNVTDSALLCLTGLTTLRTFRLQETNVSDSGLRHLARLTSLRSLDLSGVAVSGPGLARLIGLVNLERLVLSGSKVNSASVVQIIRFTNLQELGLYDCDLTDAALSQLKELRSLRSVTLFFCTGVTTSALEEIGGLANLQSLDLSGTKAAGKVMKYLRGLLRLRRLDLTLVATDAALAQVEAMSSLREFSICSTEVSDAGFKHIGTLHNLEILQAAGTKITDAGLSHVKGLTRLQDLSLADTAVTDAGLVNLYGLRKLQTLQLPVSKQITDEGVTKLQRALPNCKITRGLFRSSPMTGRATLTKPLPITSRSGSERHYALSAEERVET